MCKETQKQTVHAGLHLLPPLTHNDAPASRTLWHVQHKPYELLPPASACELLPASAPELPTFELLFLLAIARCHSGIFTTAGEIPLLKGELRPLAVASAYDPPLLALDVSSVFA